MYKINIEQTMRQNEANLCSSPRMLFVVSWTFFRAKLTSRLLLQADNTKIISIIKKLDNRKKEKSALVNAETAFKGIKYIAYSIDKI